MRNTILLRLYEYIQDVVNGTRRQEVETWSCPKLMANLGLELHVSKLWVQCSYRQPLPLRLAKSYWRDSQAIKRLMTQDFTALDKLILKFIVLKR